MQSNNLSTLDEIQRYRLSNPGAYLVIDTNVFLLFLVGVFDPHYLNECPLMTENGKKYGKEHFALMENILKLFVYKIIITPHVLSEINMLSRKKVKPEAKMHDLFSKIITQLEKCKEEQVELKIIAKNGGVIKFGFTDISLIETALKNKWVVLTDEIELYQAYREKIPIISFSSIVASEIYKARL